MDHNLLVSELQALIVESRRRYPDIKDAGEYALEILKNGPVSKDTLNDHATALLNPLTLGCKTKVAKIVGISIAALQRLVSLGGVPTQDLPAVLQTLASVANQAVDIQLKILQALLGILTYNKDVHDDVLGSALLLCFKLQESRVSVVSSTAAATLRQAVMLVFDRISTDTGIPDVALSLPGEAGSEVMLTPSGLDAFNILSDLCLLTSTSAGGMSLWGGGEKEKPRILKLGSLQRTFGLELIESILGGYEQDIKKRPELLLLLQYSLAPLLHKLQAEKPTFPISLRVSRLIFLLVRFYAVELREEVGAFLVLLLKVGTGEVEGEEGSKKDTIIPYQRVLALEAIRGICGDAALLQLLYSLYDSHATGNTKIFARLISALSHLINEKPALLGVNAEIHGLGLPSEMSNSSGYFDMGLGMVSAAASAGVSTVSSMIGTTGGGLGQQSGVKQRLIEQHDKAEAPPTPDTYPYLLALQSLNSIAEGVFHAAAQDNGSVDTARAMADVAWPALLAALSFCIATNLSDQIFAELLSAFQDFTIACGLLGLDSPRDAFLSTLGKYAVPPPVVSAMQSYGEHTSGRSASSTGAEALGLTALGVGAPTGPPSLSERNLACLKSVVTIARALSGSLGEAWHDVLEVLQNANFMMARKPNPARRPTMASPIIGAPRSSLESGDRPDTFADLDVESLQTNINALFDGTRDLNDKAFSTFVEALCKLSSEMIGVEHNVPATYDNQDISAPPTPRTPSFMLSPSDNRRRASGIQISSSIKSSERSFSLTKLRAIATLNLSRLVSNEPAVGWEAITSHLLSVARHSTAPSNIRMQASDALGELLMAAMRIAKEPRTHHQVFDALVRQVDIQPISNTPSTDYDVRSAGFISLNQILESSGHSLEVGWQTIFDMLNSVCKDTSTIKRSDSALSIMSTQTPRPSKRNQGDSTLVRIAFPAINLICTDFLSSLDSDSMRSCIACLGRFGSQKEAVNIALASIGLMWNVSDAVQGSSKDMWLYLLGELLELSRDDRLEVRSGAMQTLFRCLELYGGSLDGAMWKEVLDKIVFPLFETVQADESQNLALISVGSIFSAFLPRLSDLPDFGASYRQLLTILRRTFTSQHRACCAAALKALERILVAVETNNLDRPSNKNLLDATWTTFVDMATELESAEPFAQETLVIYVKIGTLLHQQIAWDDDRRRAFSTILCAVMTYSKSPDYRLDVDMMSPLQQAIAELVATSTDLGQTIVLSDLAEFVSLAFAGVEASSGRLTYIALAKYCMPRIGAIFAVPSNDIKTYHDGTVEAVLGALLIPVKLKYDCPAPSKYGYDAPLWKTALSTVTSVVETIMKMLNGFDIPSERLEAIWTLIMEIFAGTLLAEPSDKQETMDEDEAFIIPFLGRLLAAIKPHLGGSSVPERIRHHFAETLRKASILYHCDHRSSGGTVAPVTVDDQERMRFWAFDTLISSSSAATASCKGKDKETDVSVARACLAAFMKRVTSTMRHFLDDAKLRGHMPFPRIREEEMMYLLRHLTTMRILPDTLPVQGDRTGLLGAVSKTSSRAHLFRLYPLLLELSFFDGPMPTMWMFPDERRQIFERRADGEAEPDGETAAMHEEQELNAGDGADLIEVTGRDLAKRCLELIGEELGLSTLT